MASSGATLAITNKHEFPILVQSDVLSEDKEMSTHFIITPPLFRLDPLQSTRLRIVRTGGNFPIDRESMQWICVKAFLQRRIVNGEGQMRKIKMKNDVECSTFRK